MSEISGPGILAGKTAVVTGGGRGIGREVAQQLAAAGAVVAVTARTVAQLEETSELIRESGGICHAYPLDVLNEEQVSRTFEKIEEDLGRIDILVNNAGIANEPQLPWEQETSDWWRTLEVNLRGPYICSKAVIPGMIKRKQGRIIMMGSNLAFFPFPNASAYSASKAALVRLADNLAVALKEHSVYVFTISPGLVRTEMTRDIPDEFVKNSDWTPIERSGALCVKLASGVADVLTGRYIHSSMHDLESLIDKADQVLEKDLHTMRLVE